MKGFWPVFLILSLSTIVYTTTPVYAQSRSDGRPDGVLEVKDELQRVEREKYREASRWAAERNVPRRLTERNGRTVELVGVSGNRPIYITSHNQIAAEATHTRSLYPGQALDLDLTGLGLTIGLWDAGHALKTHQELKGRVITKDAGDPADHATHVAGTLAARGIRGEVKGMAYEANLVSYNWAHDATEMSKEGENGLLVSNHSYGMIAGWYWGDLEKSGEQWYWLGDPLVSTDEDYAFGWYNTEAAQFDRAVFTNPYLLPVVSAGNDRADFGPTGGSFRALDQNGDWQTYDTSDQFHPKDGEPDGFDTISGAALAKNVLTVGSVGLHDDHTFSVSSFSSFGPADDGRIKPDIVGYGEQLVSTVVTGSQENMNYGIMSGTSMSAPNVTGSLLLLQQYYHSLTGKFMRAATLKGLAIHTAIDLDTPGPDYRYGWGLLNAEAAAAHITSATRNSFALFEDELENGRSFVRTLVVSEPGPVRVTLSWTDRPGSVPSRSLDNAAIILRNDLDILLINETSGESILPFVLDPARPDLPAATGNNAVDPVEQVYIASAEPGEYRLVVTHKNQLVAGSPQPFSLIISGASDAMQVVAVSSIEAQSSIDEVVLHWKTLFERNKGSFHVERTPVQNVINSDKQYGKPVIIGSVDGTGSPEQARDYEFLDDDVLAGDYIYRILYDDGSVPHAVSEIEVIVPAPESFATLSNFPNPFSDQTVIVLDVPDPRTLKVEIYDALGRRVELVLDQVLPAGRHELPIDASSWSPGVYFARVTARNGVLTHRMVVVR